MIMALVRTFGIYRKHTKKIFPMSIEATVGTFRSRRFFPHRIKKQDSEKKARNYLARVFDLPPAIAERIAKGAKAMADNIQQHSMIVGGLRHSGVGRGFIFSVGFRDFLETT